MEEGAGHDFDFSVVISQLINQSSDHGHVEDPSEETHVSFALRRFENEEFIRDLIADIPGVVTRPVELEARTERLKDLLDRYQEQPQLVDPYLGPWVTALITYVKNYAENRTEENKRTADLSMVILRLLTKLRGYKVILRFLPHHVGDVEQSLSLVEESLRSNDDDWELRYMLLLWLSIAVQIPFDLRKLTDPEDVGTERSIEQRILRVCKTFIVVSDKVRDAAAYLFSRFVTRPDALPQYGVHVINYLLDTLENVRNVSSIVQQPHVISGCLAAIAGIFKSGTRTHLEQLAGICAPRLIQLDLLTSDFSVARKFYMKALQRLGLTFLPLKLPSWRYKRGYRNLEENMAHGVVQNGEGDGKENRPPMRNGLPLTSTATMEVEVEEEDIDVPEVVEQIIGLLLRGLNDSEGVVRWSSAKGMGRISERLPLSFAEDVQDGLFQLFSYEKSENAWHGGCLALAELSRRGALLPSRFSDVIPIVLKALLYEELRGTFTVGSQVRDAGCYVCWAFARAYEPKDLSQFVADIAKTLVLTALFDRSVNCRRAASAAFQEHVGRQGNFPHGLDIIPILDFEALGRRTNTYLKLSAQIAKFSEYCTIMLEFILSHRLGHWEAAMRDLSAQALLVLTPFAPGYVIDKVIPEILSRVGSDHLFTRHGALIALGCVCEGLHKCGRFDQRLAARVESVLLQMEVVQVYRGLGHELVREAVMNLIGRVSNAELPFHGKHALLNHILTLVQVNLSVESVKIQEMAVDTLRSFLKTYGETVEVLSDGSRRTVQERCLQTLLVNLKSPSEVTRRSSVLALSILPSTFIQDNEQTVIQAVVTACPRSTHSEARWVDCRRNCCRSLERIVEISPGLSSASYSEIFDFLTDCLSDYTEDTRGNIGRIVRLAALETTKAITLRIAKKHPAVLTASRMEQVVKSLVRLFAEGIHDIRSRAGQTILQLSTSSVMPDFFCKADLYRVFHTSSTPSFNWLSSGHTYPLALNMLSIPSLQSTVLYGLISSLGSLTASTMRDSSGALRKYHRDVMANDPMAVKVFARNLLEVIKETVKVERLTLPTLSSLYQIFTVGIFCGTLDVEEPQLLLDLLDAVQHVRRSQSAPKVKALVEIYAEALQFCEPVRGVALQRILIFLTHVYPRIRVLTATKLHESMMTYDDLIPAEAFDTLSTLLNEGEWAFSLEKSQEALNEIGRLLHIHVKPMLLKAKQAK